MAQYISLDSWLFCPTVTWVEKAKVGFTFEVLASFAFLTFPCQPTFLKGENDAFHFGSEVWALLTHSIFPWVLTLLVGEMTQVTFTFEVRAPFVRSKTHIAW